MKLMKLFSSCCVLIAGLFLSASLAQAAVEYIIDSEGVSCTTPQMQDCCLDDGSYGGYDRCVEKQRCVSCLSWTNSPCNQDGSCGFFKKTAEEEFISDNNVLESAEGYLEASGSHFGFANGVNKSGFGRNTAVAAKLDVCFATGELRADDFTDQEGCISLGCENHTSPNSVACSTDTCEDRCIARWP